MNLLRNQIRELRWVALAISTLFLLGCRAESVDGFLGISGAEAPTIGNSAFTFTPESYDFGNQPLAPASSDTTISVENTSTMTAYVDSVYGDSAAFTITSETCTTNSPLAVGATCTIDISFSAPSGGDHSMFLTINYGTSADASTDFYAQMTVQGSSKANAPSNFRQVAVAGNNLSFTWNDNSHNEDSFVVERCDGGGCGANFIAADSVSLPVDSAAHTWAGLTDGQFYRFRIRAASSAGNSDWLYSPTMVVFASITATDLGTGTNAKYTNASIDCDDSNETGTFVGLTWSDIASATSYTIYDVTGGGSTLIDTVSAPRTDYVVSRLVMNTAYEFKVQAITSYGESLNLETSVTTSNLPSCLGLGTPAADKQNLSLGIYDAYDIHYDSVGGRFFVADYINNRVLIYNTPPTAASVPDVVLGQADPYEKAPNSGGRSARSLRNPYSVASDGTRVAVADYNNHRVLIWNTIPTTDFAPADVVIGQPDFVTATANFDGNRNKGLNRPRDVEFHGGKLYVVDENNHRILVWNTPPTTNYSTANFVIGQTALNQGGSGTNNQKFRNPYRVSFGGTKMFVAELGNHRVSVFDPIPTATNPTMSFVLGQGSFNTRNNNDGGRNADSLSSPTGVYADANRLIVGDTNNHRVLVWTALPTAMKEAADFAIGPDNMTSAPAASGTIRVRNPAGITGDPGGTAIWIADRANRRVLRHDANPTADGEAHDALVVGQQAFNTTDHNYVPRTDSSTRFPFSAVTDGTHLAIADTGSNRVMVWNTFPTTDDQAADFVLGQPNFTSSNANNGGRAFGFNSPQGMSICNNQLLVADYNNHRVLVFNLPITANQQQAALVIGQTNLNNGGAGTAQNRLRNPRNVHCDAATGRVLIAERGNHRVTIWDNFPTVNGENATDLLGQNAWNTRNNNQGGRNSDSLSSPSGVTTIGNKVAVADVGNDRVLIWNSFPNGIKVPADVVIGQPNMTTGGNDTGGHTFGLQDVEGVTSNGTYLAISDTNNHRILLFNTPPTTNFQQADAYLGQTTLNAGTGYALGTKSGSVHTVYGAEAWNNRLLIPDYNGRRVMIIPIPE